jgi:4-amino-4-deoxy-L-arabinose transferase
MQAFVLFSSVVCFFISIYFFLINKKLNTSLVYLCLASFFIRFYSAGLDPFLHTWDEAFHALVAKNMITNPFIPMLRVDAILPYDYTSWCCNHIWLHKQPLFLWQMALSMKIFGVNEMALRLPSVILGAISPYFIFRIAEIWTRDKMTAFIASILFTFSYYQLELTSGFISLDHNDFVFTIYITASIWAFCEYINKPTLRWVLLIGFFAGLAILVKWLAGLLVFGGWGLYNILSRVSYKKYLPLLGSGIVAILIMLPWQIYIIKSFPKESAWEYSYNLKHITEALGAVTSKDIFYYLKNWEEQYTLLMLPFLILGVYWLLFSFRYEKKISISMLSMVIAVYAFFSIVVFTKMLAFVYIVSPILLVITAIGLNHSITPLLTSKRPFQSNALLASFFILIAIGIFKPIQIRKNHSSQTPYRSESINNARIYKSVNDLVSEGTIIINCKEFEDTKLMFYQGFNAYHWYPGQIQVDSLISAGYKIAAFQSHTNQILPEYILNNSKIAIITQELK